MLGLIVSTLLFASCGNSDNGSEFPDATAYDLQLPFYFGDNIELSQDNLITNEGVDLGRRLFYDKRMSLDNTVSCGSCHQQSLGFTDGLAVSVGIDGQETSRSSMALANLLWSSHFFWDGRAGTLEEQALEPIENPIEMNQSLPATIAKLETIDEYPDLFARAFGTPEITEERIAKALAQFMRILISSESRYDQFLLGDETALSEQEKLGMELFFKHPEPSEGLRGGNCGDCHVNILTSGVFGSFDGFKNNGLDTDENLDDGLFAVTGRDFDRGKFKIPSLRNIALTAPYMHDGRFATLEAVIDHYNDNIVRSSTLDPLILAGSNEEIVPGEDIRLHLTQEEKDAILAFLHTLTDNVFITNEKFSNPFSN